MSKGSGNREKPWTDSDVAELQSFVAEEMSVEEMAEELGRTPGAIRAKLAKEGISLSAAQEDVDDE
jgi:predicted transcriptional regulator